MQIWHERMKRKKEMNGKFTSMGGRISKMSVGSSSFINNAMSKTWRLQRNIWGLQLFNNVRGRRVSQEIIS
jgi:hypothetical protein